MNDLPLRPNVCLLIFNRQGKLFLGERNGHPNHWQFPQGGVEVEISVEENVVKEAHEETGAKLESFQIVQQLATTNQYDFDLTPAYAVGRWRGQSQTFWAVEFTGAEDEIDLAASHREFMNWRWCTFQEVRELAAPRRLKGYQSALEEFEVFWRRRTTGA